MGSSSKATLSYGFVLQESQIKKLLAAIENKGEGEDEGAGEHDLGPGKIEWIETIVSWLQGNKCEEECKPFLFEVEGNPIPDGSSRRLHGEVTLAIIFAGETSSSFDEDPSAEIWGSEDSGSTFTAIESASLLTNEDFMNAAKDGFRKLENTKEFQKAGITVTVPQWILRLSTC